MPSILFTGFPGFLGSALLPRVLARTGSETSVACLVQDRFADLAHAKLDQLVAESPQFANRVELVQGDITRGDLGGDPHLDQARERITEVFHLAAVYDLGVDEGLAMAVNVDGTRNVLSFCEQCDRLSRLHYVSTCYVSGRYDGVFRETDLAVGQSFNNHYEETKYLAEVAVQNAMAGGLPATIYRPAVVTGDSRTGATQKYDGPYYILRWLLKQPRRAVMPVSRGSDSSTVNVVPSDFIVDAVSYLSSIGDSSGKVYQLCDPNPLTVNEMLDRMGQATGRNIVRLTIPASMTKAALRRIPGLGQWSGIKPEAVDYFNHPTTYAGDNALADLEPAGIVCPGFSEYVDRLVGFLRANPDVPSAAMV